MTFTFTMLNKKCDALCYRQSLATCPQIVQELEFSFNYNFYFFFIIV